MKIALAQLNYTVGDFDLNTSKIIEHVNKAKSLSVDLLVFGEQAVSGSPAYDLLNKVSFLDLCEDALVEIASHCIGITVLVGSPAQLATKTISVAALLENGKISRYIGKKNISARDELAHISPSEGCEYINIAGAKIAVVVGNDIRTEQLYGEYADLIVNLANTPYSRGIVEKRYDFYRQLAFMTGKMVLYVNNVGGQTDIVYDGSSAVFNSRGEAVLLLKNFEEDFQSIDLNEDHFSITLPYQNKTQNVYRAIKLGLADYFHKNNFKKVCIGLSGGIDSAVVAALAVEVLGADKVDVILMPSQFSSDHSVEDALELVRNVGVVSHTLPITDVFESVLMAMKPVFWDLPFDVAEENIQARIRSLMLMAYVNKFDQILLNTSNKSEIAVGYGAIYGDTVGALGVISDLYKCEVYDLARYINRDKEVIPYNIITKAPSAELRPEQKDSDTLPAYDILDAILYRMLEEGQSREEIINAGFDEEEVYRVYNLVIKSEYKRYQLCPVLRLSTCVLGKNRTMPLTSHYGL